MRAFALAETEAVLQGFLRPLPDRLADYGWHRPADRLALRIPKAFATGMPVLAGGTDISMKRTERTSTEYSNPATSQTPTRPGTVFWDA
jgi:hypothetical protein